MLVNALNRRIPFDPEGRLAAILERRKALGLEAFVFGTADGAYQAAIQTAWETLRLPRTATSAGVVARTTRGTASNSSPAGASAQ